MLLLVPSDPLEPRTPDEHFAVEAAVARDLGLSVALIDHDALCSVGGASDAVRRVSPDQGEATYRGWMVSSGQYADLADALASRGVQLRTSPASYRAAHELPGWYDAFRHLTATTVWLDGPDLTDLSERLDALPAGPAIIKDFVKSMKHHWDEATYVPDVRDTTGATAVARRFLELRGDQLVGGVVVRSFEDYVPGEARTWWINGRCSLVTAHPDTPDHVPPDPPVDALAEAVAKVGNPFMTIDLAVTDAGAWRVVEVGDGQVSDRPSTVQAAELIALLA